MTFLTICVFWVFFFLLFFSFNLDKTALEGEVSYRLSVFLSRFQVLATGLQTLPVTGIVLS